MKYILMFFVIATLFGCSSTPQIKYVDRVEVVEVEKPVFTIPKEIKELEPLDRPKPEYTNLTEEDKNNPKKVIDSALKSILQLETHIEKYETREKKIIEALDEAERQSKEGN
jgi:hypothetical protein